MGIASVLAKLGECLAKRRDMQSVRLSIIASFGAALVLVIFVGGEEETRSLIADYGVWKK